MKIEIPIRKVEIFQAEDGRKIEQHTTKFVLKTETEEDIDKSEINQDDIVYFGVAHLETPIGPQEIKFPIEAKNLKEAFINFVENLQEMVKELEKAHNQISPASQHDLQMIDAMENQKPSKGKIIF